MAKKGKAKTGAAPAEGGQEVTVPTASSTTPAAPVRPAPEKPVKDETPKPAKETKVPAPEKKVEATVPVQSPASVENGANGGTGEVKRKNSRRDRKQKAGEGEGAEQPAKDAEAGNLYNQKKRLRKKRSKLARALELAQSSGNAQKAALEEAASGEAALSPEELRKRLEVVENLLKHVQAKTQEEQKKVEALKSGPKAKPEPKAEEKKESKARKESESSPKNLTSERVRKEADVKKLTNEKVQMQNEAKRLVEEKARKEQEMKKLIEEKAKKDAEAKALLEEKAARDAELARLNQAKARVETVELKINELDQKSQQRKETEEVKAAPGSSKQKKDQARTRKDSESNKKKEADEKAKKEAEEKAKKEAAEKAKKEAEEKAKKEAAEKAKKDAEEKAKKESEEKAKKQAEEKMKQEAAEKAKKQAEEEAKRKQNGESVKQPQNGSAPTTPTQDKPAAPKQDAKNNKKNSKRTPKNSLSEDEKSAAKGTGSKNGPSGDFASSAETVTVAKSQELQSAPAPSKAPEAAAGPKAAPKPSNGKPAAAAAAPAPANGKPQTTPPAKTTEKTQQPKTAARTSPPKTTAKAPSPPKTAPAATKAAPKPSTPPASKKPEPPPKPEFLKKKSPPLDKKETPAPQAPAAAPAPSSAPASPAPAPAPAPATPTAPVPVPASDAAAAARLTEEALNGAKKPAPTPSAAAASAAAAAGSNNSKPKPVQKKPEVPPKPDVHNKSAAKMKTPIKQPSGKATSTSDCRSPAAELSRKEAFKKNMDIISTIADVLLSYPRSKRNRADAAGPSEPTKSSFDPSSLSLESSASPASLFSSLFPSQSSGPSTGAQDHPSSASDHLATTSSSSADSAGSDAKAPKQKSKIDLERILRILQSTQNAQRAAGGTEQPSTSSSPSTTASQPTETLADAALEGPLGSFLTPDAIRMLMPTLKEVNVKLNVEKQLEALNATAAMAKLFPKTLPPGTDTTEEDELEEDLLDEESDDTIEYKFTPRPVFIATICQMCKNPLKTFFHCERCRMVSYCSEDHRRLDQPPHRDLCAVLADIASLRGGHIYHMARKLNVQEYRNLRVHTLSQIELTIKRPLQAFEREIVLFPRICLAPDCREWNQELLTECKDCRQVSYCAAQPMHLQQSHSRWCKAYLLFQKLILRQRLLGRIEPVLPVRIVSKPTPLAANIDETFKQLYKNSSALRDECVYSVLSQIATAPLTALYAYQQTGLPFGKTFTIHLVGAELQFEGDTLDKWEAFFLHLVPEVAVLRVVFVGPELNVENLPIDIISRIRMCRTCRTKCRVVAFDFQCRTMYHDYRHSSRYQRPDLICFFNPGLHRFTGYAGLDSWPQTIRTATEAGCPMLVTAYTELESPLDLERLQRESTRVLQVTRAPSVNPFGSKRPDRNFISEETAPMIFKNYFYFLVQ
uniref:MYND-type domain-containing protein n=1 Tax=Anopheles atroparvus TaxID=41427 RepID=A0AAG5DLY4_ANOAO